MAPGWKHPKDVSFSSFQIFNTLQSTIWCIYSFLCARADCGVHAYRLSPCPAVGIQVHSLHGDGIFQGVYSSMHSGSMAEESLQATMQCIHTCLAILQLLRFPAVCFLHSSSAIFFYRKRKKKACAWSGSPSHIQIPLLPFSRAPHVAMSRIKPVQISGSISSSPLDVPPACHQ